MVLNKAPQSLAHYHASVISKKKYIMDIHISIMDFMNIYNFITDIDL